MTRVQGASIAALLALIATGSHADTVVVNTTLDEDQASNKQCSLREAVRYINSLNIIKKDLAPLDANLAVINSKVTSLNYERKMYSVDLEGAVEPLKSQLEAKIKDIDNQIKGYEAEIAVVEEAKKTIQNEITQLQVFGCVPTVVSDVDEIDLGPQSTPFLITKGAIVIKDTLTIRSNEITQTSDATSESTISDFQPAIIKVSGNSRAFLIDDGVTDQKIKTQVKFYNIRFQGCRADSASTDICAVDGGIFFNKEELSLSNVTLKLGGASGKGGAVYNAGEGILVLGSATFESNKAPTGAAVYSEKIGVNLTQSLFYKNEATAPAGAVVHVDTSASPDASSLVSRFLISDSTFTKNAGIAISVPKELRLLSLTVVDNTAGVDFRNTDINLSSSIIAGNSSDCLNVGVSTRFRYNLFMSAGCPIGLPADSNRKITGSGNETLFAGSSSDAATCNAPPAVGILCPLGYFGGLTKSHKPRLLASYTALSDSPIVNKGQPTTGFVDTDCNGTDQRFRTRTLCDIGAVELVSDGYAKQGQDVISGQSVTFNMLEKIGDGELFPAAFCGSAVTDPRADLSKDGCPFLTAMPGKGVVNFNNATHQVEYQPNSSYHGFDLFSYSVTTTLSRFSDANNNRGLITDVKIVADPKKGIESKSFAGPFGIWGIFSLAGLVILRLRAQRGSSK
ncbi:MAG TPA: CSLREA domain-containing protein [Fluviicoccus sp.]|nr:CSLREA domain-containing protein [Fluviicoccus sp.]